MLLNHQQAAAQQYSYFMVNNVLYITCDFKGIKLKLSALLPATASKEIFFFFFKQADSSMATLITTGKEVRYSSSTATDHIHVLTPQQMSDKCKQACCSSPSSW